MVLDGEVKPEELADPLVLRDGGEALSSKNFRL
jgi:hypothetical protein